MSKLKFSREPKISFTRVTCPFCKAPTGPSSTCYASENANKNLTITKDGSVLSLFNEGCMFRQEYLWFVDINYPTSEPLLLKLQGIPGINKLSIMNPHKIQIGISPIFDETEVKKEVTHVFKTFVKEMAITEKNLSGIEIFKPKYICIKMPNGNISRNKCDSEEEFMLVMSNLQDIKDNIPEAEIFEEA